MSRQNHPKKTSPTDWHPADVIAAVRKKGSSIRRLSLAAGLHPRSLGHALVQPWFTAQKIIADCIGLPPDQIWPTRYEADGSHKRGLRGKSHQHAKCNAATGLVNGKDGEAK